MPRFARCERNRGHTPVAWKCPCTVPSAAVPVRTNLKISCIWMIKQHLLRRHDRNRVDDPRSELTCDRHGLVEGRGIGDVARQHDLAVDGQAWIFEPGKRRRNSLVSRVMS